MQCIRDFGTTDNYNTDIFKCLHIDFAKKGWSASNKQDEVPQMIKWLERQEKVASMEHLIEIAREEEGAHKQHIAQADRQHSLDLHHNSNTQLEHQMIQWIT